MFILEMSLLNRRKKSFRKSSSWWSKHSGCWCTCILLKRNAGALLMTLFSSTSACEGCFPTPTSIHRHLDLINSTDCWTLLLWFCSRAQENVFLKKSSAATGAAGLKITYLLRIASCCMTNSPISS